VIQQVLSNKKIFVFGELLALPSVATLDGSEHMKSFKTLELFAYGTWAEYRDSGGVNSQLYIELNEVQIMKLKQLTIVSLAEQNKIIAYSTLLKELDIISVRALEDLIIDTIYGGLISGKIDQQEGIFRVKNTIGRDVRAEKLTDMIAKMESWSDRCKSILISLDKSSSHIRIEREAGKAEQDKTQKSFNEAKEIVQDSMADGEIRDRDDDGFSQKGMGLGLGGGGGSFRGAKRTRGTQRGITGIGGGSFNASSGSSSQRDRMDTDATY